MHLLATATMLEAAVALAAASQTVPQINIPPWDMKMVSSNHCVKV
eukprot:SAG11_NODE_36297_length_262_cov_0.914110_1_plen_44_part_01